MGGEVFRLVSRRDKRPVERRDGRYVLAGEQDWLLTGPSEDVAAVSIALAGVCELLGDGVLLLTFGNAVGYFAAPGLGTLEVVSSKWGRADFERMLADLTDVAAGLPFAAGTSAALPYDRSVATREDVLYHLFVYLRHVLSDAPRSEDRLLPALRLIVRQPHQRFLQTRANVPLPAARGIDARTLIQLTSGQGGFSAVGMGAQARSPLARQLRGHLPIEIDERQVVSTFDTPENRFVKAFLGQLAGIVDGMRRVVGKGGQPDAFGRRILADCDTIVSVLRPISEHAVWHDVGPLGHLPASSPVLQRRRGYRETYRHFARLRLAARVPLDEGLLSNLLEAKDIAQLYELWCYFALVRMLGDLKGAPVRAGRPTVGETAVKIPWDLEVAWSDGTRLLYNPRFSRSRSDDRWSYSVPLRPDIALEVPGGLNAGLHLFDAKFRLERLEQLLSPVAENEPDDEKAAERVGTFKRGDLYKVHTYRDAIPRARSVWVLYPGTRGRFFHVRGDLTEVGAQSLSGGLDGVGAIPLIPDQAVHSELLQVLNLLHL